MIRRRGGALWGRRAVETCFRQGGAARRDDGAFTGGVDASSAPNRCPCFAEPSGRRRCDPVRAIAEARGRRERFVAMARRTTSRCQPAPRPGRRPPPGSRRSARPTHRGGRADPAPASRHEGHTRAPSSLTPSEILFMVRNADVSVLAPSTPGEAAPLMRLASSRHHVSNAHHADGSEPHRSRRCFWHRTGPDHV